MEINKKVFEKLPLVFSLILLLASIGLVIILKDQINVLFSGAENFGEVIRLDYAIKFGISLLITFAALLVLFYQWLKSQKLSKSFLILSITITLALFFNNIIFTAFIGLMELFDVIVFDYFIFEIFLFGFFIFIFSSFFFLSNLLKLSKEELKSVQAKNLSLKKVEVLLPPLLIFAGIIFINNLVGVIVSITITTIIIAIYSGIIFASQILEVLNRSKKVF